MVEGKLQKEGEVIHVIVKRCYDLSRLLRQLSVTEEAPPSLLTLSRADEKDPDTYPTQKDKRQPHTVVQTEIFHAGRNFK